MAATPPTLPQATTTAIPSETVTGTTFTVNAGGDLQAALNSAAAANPNLNHAVVIAAGATFSGNFVCPVKVGTGWVQVKSSAMASLPALGTQVGPGDAANMPKISSPNSQSAFSIAGNNQGWRLSGLEITTSAVLNASNNGRLFNLVIISGTGPNGEHASFAAQPTRHIIDRCYIHGIPNTKITRAVLINGRDITVQDNYVDDIRDSNDATGIGGYNGCGPFLIKNNFSQASGQCIFFGGADSQAVEFIPSDIRIQLNRLSKKLIWNPNPLPGDPATNMEVPAGDFISVKPHIELKCAQRVLIEGNTFVNGITWPFLTFDAFNQGGTAPWSIVQDVTARYNRFDYGGCVAQTWSGNVPVRRVKIHDNLATRIKYDFNLNAYARGAMYRSTGGTETDVWFDHNTVFCDGTSIVLTAAGGFDRLTLTNNIIGYGNDGISVEGPWNGTDAAIAPVAPGFVFQSNAWLALLAAGQGPVLSYTQAAWNPPNSASGEWFVIGDATAAGIDTATGALGTSSPLKAGGSFQGADGKNNGVDLAALATGLAGGATSDSYTETWTHADAGSLTADQTWTQTNGTNWGISGNKATLLATNGSTNQVAICQRALNSPDHKATVTLDSYTQSSNSQGGLIICSDATGQNYYMFRAVNSAFDMYKVTGGSSFQLLGSSGTAAASAQVLEFSRTGTGTGNLVAKVNGTAIITATDASLSGLNQGIFGFRGGALDVAVLDNFSAQTTGGPAQDTTAPSVSITAPANNATISGTVNVTANVTDAGGVSSVRFFVDGTQSGNAQGIAPFALSLNTNTLSNGPHTIRVDGQDVSGNTGSASITVTVNNVALDMTAPTVAITSPPVNATLQGTVNVQATATDAVGIATVKFFLDGVQTGATLTHGPFVYAVDTTQYGNGIHTLRVDAADAAGNIGTASQIVAIVNPTQVIVNVPGPTQFVTVEVQVPGPTVFVPIPAVTSVVVGGTIDNMPPGNYRAMLIVVDENKTMVAPPAFALAHVPTSGSVQNFSFDLDYLPQPQKVSW